MHQLPVLHQNVRPKFHQVGCVLGGLLWKTNMHVYSNEINLTFCFRPPICLDRQKLLNPLNYIDSLVCFAVWHTFHFHIFHKLQSFCRIKRNSKEKGCEKDRQDKASWFEVTTCPTCRGQVLPRESMGCWGLQSMAGSGLGWGSMEPLGMAPLPWLETISLAKSLLLWWLGSTWPWWH